MDVSNVINHPALKMDFSLSFSILIVFLLKFFTHGLPIQEELYGIKYMNIKHVNGNISIRVLNISI